MKIELARHLAMTAFRSSANLTELAPVLKQHCEEHEYDEYLKTIATVSAEIHCTLLNKIFDEHPCIEKEIEDRIDKWGFLIVG